MTKHIKENVVTCSLVGGDCYVIPSLGYCLRCRSYSCDCELGKESIEKRKRAIRGAMERTSASMAGVKIPTTIRISLGTRVSGNVVSVDGRTVTLENVAVSAAKMAWRKAAKTDRWAWIATGVTPLIGEKIEVLESKECPGALVWRPVEAKAKQSNTVSAGERRRLAIAAQQDADERERMNEAMAA